MFSSLALGRWTSLSIGNELRRHIISASVCVSVCAAPLTSDYFDQLSVDIGTVWIRLAERLKLSHAAIQRIAQSNAHYSNAAKSSQRCAHDVLGQWFRSSAKSHDRVRNLYPLFRSVYTPTDQLRHFSNTLGGGGVDSTGDRSSPPCNHPHPRRY